jgi:prevent-host-death family protein
MIEVGAYEAKTHLPCLLDKVARGQRITITRHGVPVAMLVPIEEKPKMSRQEAVEAIRAFRKGHRLDGLTIREMIEEGRKY